MTNSKVKSFHFSVLPFYFLVLTFFGCATIPPREALPTYQINGITYIPLVSLCEVRGIKWEYDSFAKTVILNKGVHKISLMTGEPLVLVDGKPLRLKYPVDIYQGTIVVPYRFKEQVVDVFFKESIPRARGPQHFYKIKKIVIDAGHGGNDPGAIGKTGLKEKDVTLDIAKRLNRLLRSYGVEVVMTRSTDRFVSLASRVNIANNSKVDLFLSIHANANYVRSLSGFEVYYVSPTVDDSRRALSAAEEAGLDIDSGCFASHSLDLKAILWDMIYTHNRAESIELATDICRTIDGDLDTRILGIKGARFYVLKGVRMPGILIETGFLSNYNEEHKLRNSFYRQKIAEAIVEGISNYTKDLTLAEASHQ
jgi:N-acetylmuramoyl-L-alanine amidase